MIKRIAWFFATLSMIVLACVGYRLSPLIIAAPHPLDPIPVSTPAHNTLSHGMIETKFVIDTGGDQMSFGRSQAALGVIVRFADRNVEQLFASCHEAFADDTPLESLALTSASCDKRLFYITTGNGAVNVIENVRGTMVTQSSIPLPKGIKSAALSM